MMCYITKILYVFVFHLKRHEMWKVLLNKAEKKRCVSVSTDYLCEMKAKPVNQDSSLEVPCFAVIYLF